MSQRDPNKYYTFSFCLAIGILLVATGCFFQKTTLLDLQKKIASATENDLRGRILSQLDSYYLKMPIPDSIRQQVEDDVKKQLEKQARDDLLSFNFDDEDTNIYNMENSLGKILQYAIIARVKGDDSISNDLIEKAKNLALDIDTRNKIDYWQNSVRKVASFSAEQSFQWLSARQAESLCNRNHLSNYEDAEKYGALGLQYLQECQDERLRLDISQRLMTILYRSRRLFDLSLHYGQRAYQNAKNINYYLRATGILLNNAEAFLKSGKVTLALRAFNETVENAKKYSSISSMDWYFRNGLIGIARANWEAGKYQETLSLCAEIRKFNLKDNEKVLLHITEGIAYRNIGSYDSARDAYDKALVIARKIDDNLNQIEILRNTGILYYRLTEYDKANYYYKEALNLNRNHFSQNKISEGEILICLAETKTAQQKTAEADSLLSLVKSLVKQVEFPALKAILSRSLGRLNFRLKRYDQAYLYFQQAYVQYEESGLFRAALETKSDLAQCLLNQSKLKEAKEILTEVLKTSRKSNDSQRKIDAIGMFAEIACLEGQIDHAIQFSNQIIKETDEVSDRFNDIDNLTIFRQKIHEYLREAVVYELQKGRLDSAFVKLDYFKTRALKDRFEIEKIGNLNHNNLNSLFINIEAIKTKLGPNQLVISYFTTEDTLYAFVLDNQNLMLLKKAVKADYIKNLTDDYTKYIIKTIDVFQNEPLSSYPIHYDSTVFLGHRLYQNLFEWDELPAKLVNSKITYIIPDDVFYILPFSSLTNLNDTNSKFLIHQTAVIYLPGAICLQTIEGKKSNHEILNKRVLISANCDLSGAESLLGFVKQNYSNVKELSINKQIANREEIISELNQKYDIYILFGHSKANRVLPDSSYFELSVLENGNSKASNLKMYASDFKKIDWSHADLILLIGCETAVGKLYKGTGLAGIQQAILASGGKSILATLWEIESNQAFEQIRDFLEFMKKLENPAIALQQSNIKCIENLTQNKIYQKPHPFIWGSFVLLQSKLF